MKSVLFFLIFLLSFFITFKILPKLMHRIKSRGITGKDMNKLSQPEIPELGGLGIITGFGISSLLSLFFYSYTTYFSELNLTSFLGALSTIFVMGFLGTVDDIVGWKKGIRQYQHALLPLIAALPLMVLPESIQSTSMVFPFLGRVEFGILYSLIIVPIAVTGASNATNMLAGLNGLEAGLGIIIASTILVISFIKPDPTGQLEVIILMVALIGALLAFLKYNWFPAKVFPGDSLTLLLGASFASVAIIGNMEKIGLLLFVLYFVELGFKAKHKFQTESFGIPQKDGTLKADPRGGSLTQWVMRRGKFTEKQVVLIILGMQILISLTVFLLVYFQLL